MIRKKRFYRYLINNCYPIVLDGTGKFNRDWLWDEECLEQPFTKDNETWSQYHVYVLETNLAFRDVMTIPLMSEVLIFTRGDIGNDKQDCELKAFYRLKPRLKAAFPALKIMILLDGLFAKGPAVIEICRKYNWEFMIVLQDKAFPSVMNEFKSLSALDGKNCQILHVVECKESWREISLKTGQTRGENQPPCRTVQ